MCSNTFDKHQPNPSISAGPVVGRGSGHKVDTREVQKVNSSARSTDLNGDCSGRFTSTTSNVGTLMSWPLLSGLGLGWMCRNADHVDVNLPTHSNIEFLTQSTMRKWTFYRSTKRRIRLNGCRCSVVDIRGFNLTLYTRWECPEGLGMLNLTGDKYLPAVLATAESPLSIENTYSLSSTKHARVGGSWEEQVWAEPSGHARGGGRGVRKDSGQLNKHSAIS